MRKLENNSTFLLLTIRAQWSSRTGTNGISIHKGICYDVSVDTGAWEAGIVSRKGSEVTQQIDEAQH